MEIEEEQIAERIFSNASPIEAHELKRDPTEKSKLILTSSSSIFFRNF